MAIVEDIYLIMLAYSFSMVLKMQQSNECKINDLNNTQTFFSDGADNDDGTF